MASRLASERFIALVNRTYTNKPNTGKFWEAAYTKAYQSNAYSEPSRQRRRMLLLIFVTLLQQQEAKNLADFHVGWNFSWIFLYCRGGVKKNILQWSSNMCVWASLRRCEKPVTGFERLAPIS